MDVHTLTHSSGRSFNFRIFLTLTPKSEDQTVQFKINITLITWPIIAPDFPPGPPPPPTPPSSIHAGTYSSYYLMVWGGRWFPRTSCGWGWKKGGEPGDAGPDMTGLVPAEAS